MAIDVSRTARGALAGATAAALWAAQEPLDQRAFTFPYSDVELLGKLVTRRPAWRAVGLVLHLANGAAFGAAYANLAPRLPVARWLRGPLAGLIEHASTWPLTALSDRVHPAREEMPALADSPRAFLQATWRHLLFAIALGELERRLNPEPEDPAAVLLDAGIVSSNGHGTIERARSAVGGRA